jgi:predicted nucleic acid-binding protein
MVVKRIPLPCDISIDANVINSKNKIDAMNTIFAWAEQNKIAIFYTEQPMVRELTKPSSQFAKLNDFMFQILPECGSEYFRQIQEAVFPHIHPLDSRQKSDIEHLCGHLSSGNDFFITHDRAILDAGTQLMRYGIRVITPEDFVSRHEKNIEDGNFLFVDEDS